MSETNPYDAYQAPKTVLERVEVGQPELADRGERLLAAIVDTIIGIVLLIPVWIAFDFTSYMVEEKEIPVRVEVLSDLMSFGLFLLVHGYYIANTAQTVGKRIVNIRVANLDNSNPALWRLVVLRYFSQTLMVMIPYVGIPLWIVNVLFVFRADRRCIHDFVAGTKVVKV